MVFKDREKIEIRKLQHTNEAEACALMMADSEPWITLRRHKETKEDSLWQGRVCKIYTKMSSGEWKMIFQTGALDFSKITG